MNVLEPGTPCPYCQVRPDVACRHRPADPTWTMRDPPVPKPDPRRGGWNSSGSFSQLNGTRSFVNARTGQTMRVKGRGD